MSKQEIYKLQLDAFMKPHVMWRIETTKDVNDIPLDLLKEVSFWEWNVDIEHDAHTAYWTSMLNWNGKPVYDNLVDEITECCLMQVDPEGYDNISDEDFSELAWYVYSKLQHVIKDEAFHDDVYEFYYKFYNDYNNKINNLIK
jgi:hypothetical protein